MKHPSKYIGKKARKYQIPATIPPVNSNGRAMTPSSGEVVDGAQVRVYRNDQGAGGQHPGGGLPGGGGAGGPPGKRQYSRVSGESLLFCCTCALSITVCLVDSPQFK